MGPDGLAFNLEAPKNLPLAQSIGVALNLNHNRALRSVCTHCSGPAG